MSDWQTLIQRALQGTVPVSQANVDLDRQERCGAPEVVYGSGKCIETIVEVFRTQHAAGQSSLVTRVSDEQIERLQQEFPSLEVNRLARTAALFHPQRPSPQGQVLILTAGSSDRPVAEEALETARWMGTNVTLFDDVGVAGPQRLLARLPELRAADVVIVVAGMEGALPSAVAGWVAVPVIAVPTSVGYGANQAGVTTVLSMLTSCAANVAVVNIDAGFKAGYLAGMIARGRERRVES